MTTSDATHEPADVPRRRVAVVTGGAKGIGWATVQAFVTMGMVPVLLDRDGQALAAAGETLTRQAVDHLWPSNGRATASASTPWHRRGSAPS